MAFKPSKYQKKIFKFINEETGNAVINAVAGSGKTTTLIESLKLVDPNLSILFLAFNKNIKQEIEKRIKAANLSVDINTCHGFGYSTILRNTDKEIVLDNNKYFKLLKDLIKYGQSDDIEAIKHYNFTEDDMQYTVGFNLEFQNKKEIIEFQKNVTNLTNLLRLYVSKEPADIEMIIDKYDIVLSDKEIELAIQLLTLGQKLNNIIDYTDMLYLPLFYDYDAPQYDLVYIDECFPYNTFISTKNGKMKIGQLEKQFNNNIELPMVSSFNEITKEFEDKKIKKVWCNGTKEVYKVILGGKRVVKSTKNHKYLTHRGWVEMEHLKIGDAILSNYTEQPYHSIYIGDKLEILLGTSIGDSSISKLSENIYRIRCIHGEQQEEYIRWKANSLNVNVSTIEKNGYSGKKAFTFSTKGFFYDKLDKSGIIKDITAKSLAITFMDDGSLSVNGYEMRLFSLAEHSTLVTELQTVLKDKFDIESTFSTANSSSTNNPYYYLRFNKENLNKLSLLIAPYVHPSMKYKVLKEHQHLCDLNNWDNLYDNNFGCIVVTKEMEYSGIEKVYDMEVEDNHNFIVTSNTWTKNIKAKDFGIIAHNCQDLNTAQRLLMLKSVKPNGRFIGVGDKNQAIYGFAGSDDESFDKITEIPNTTILSLSETYRCGHNIVETVKHIVPQIVSHKNNVQGVVNKTDSVNNIAYGDMVLCRNTYPLVKLCLKFITENKKANVMGADIGKTLIKLIESTNETKTVNAIAKLYADLQTVLNRIMRTYNISPENAMRKGEYTNALERIKVFEIIYNDLSEDKRELVENITAKLAQIFKDERDGILLSTIHRAKGLESDKVFIIHSELMPSPYAKKMWELKQEDNLIYVARTRAIQQLSYVTDFDAYETMGCESVDISHIVIKESQHVGSIGQRMVLEGEVIEVKHIESYNEDIFVVQDKEGNIFEHWGRIPQHFVTEKNLRIKIGTNIKGNIKITKHTSFNDVNKNAFKCYK